jgi:hypothetical protein
LRLSADRAENAASKPARKAGVLDPEEKVPRETDSPLEGDGFEPSVPREGVKGQDPQFHADYPAIGWARMKRMLNGFKRHGITCPAQTRCQPDRLI